MSDHGFCLNRAAARLAFAAFCSYFLVVPPKLVAQEVSAGVGSTSVYLGQPFEYQVRVTDTEAAELKPFKSTDFKATLRGQPSLQRSMSIINGSMTSKTTLIYSYAMTAEKVGKFVIPAPVVTINRKDFTGNNVTVEVIGPDESNLFSITTQVVPKRVYPMQRFTVEVEVSMRALDNPYTVVSPVSSRVLDENPRLTIPWLDSQSLPDGIEETEPLDLRSIQSRDRSGFTLTGVRGFPTPRFLPEAEKFTPKNNDEPDGEEPREWFRYTFTRNFIATRAGEFSLGRATLQGDLVEKIERNRGTLKTVFGVSDPALVNITPLPLDDRPDSWCGVIGDLDVQSSITPTTASVGQPLTLTLSLSGTGSLNDAFPPDLRKDESITQKFRVYEATSKPTSTGRVFTYSLRAKDKGNTEFPAVELSWFNTISGEYVTGKTSPISLEIKQATQLATSNIIDNPRPASAATLEATTNGLNANFAALDVQHVHAETWFLMWGGIATATALAWLATGREVSASSLRKGKLKTRLAAAESKLDEGMRAWTANDNSDSISRVREAINRIVCAVLDSDDEGLTTEEVGPKMAAAGFEPQLVEQTTGLLQTFDTARYAGMTEQQSDVQTQAKQIVHTLLTAARGMGRQA